jgi:hypothetical protein
MVSSSEFKQRSSIRERACLAFSSTLDSRDFIKVSIYIIKNYIGVRNKSVMNYIQSYIR